MMYWLLLFGCLLLLSFAWWMEGGRWASPSVIVSFCISLVVGMSILGLGRWNSVVLDLQGKTVAVIFLGCAAFLIGCSFMNLVFDGRSALHVSNSRAVVWLPSINRLFVLAFVGSVGTVIWYLLIGRNLGTFNPIALSTALKNGVGDVEPTIATGFRCLTYSICAFACALAGLGAARKEKRLVFLAVIVGLCSAAPSAVSAIRTNILHLIVGALVAFSMGCVVLGRGKKLKLKKIIFVFIAVYILVQLFYFAVQLSGRSAHYDSPLDYIEFYLAGSIPALDGFMRNNVAPTGVSETFSGLQDIAQRLGIIDSVAPKASNHWAVVNYSYDGVTNIYTFIRPALHDFGFGGLVLYMIVLGILFQLLYRKALDRGSLSSFVVYSYLAYILVESMRDDFFSYWLGLEGLVTLVLLLLCIYWVFPIREDGPGGRQTHIPSTDGSRPLASICQLGGKYEL